MKLDPEKVSSEFEKKISRSEFLKLYEKFAVIIFTSSIENTKKHLYKMHDVL